MTPPRLSLQDTALLVVDLQDKLLPVIEEANRVVQKSAQLIAAAAALDMPVLVTEQYPKGLGSTTEAIQECLPESAVVIEKTRFSAAVPAVMAELRRLKRRTVLVCGIEAHVCVQQTCLDLLAADMTAAVVLDAVSARELESQRIAELRMVQAGVVPTSVEACLFELAVDAKSPRFKPLLNIIK